MNIIMTIKPKNLKEEVKTFWDNNPCGTYLSKERRQSRAYFDELEYLRYHSYLYNYGYLKETIGFDRYNSKKVLEVGCGIGTDLMQFARAGADVTGIDLTREGINGAKKRFSMYDLKATLEIGDAENLKFKDNSFDLAYSFGVLHHTPNTEKAISELFRVLKNGGEAKVMLYHKYSFETFTHIIRKLKNQDRWSWSFQEALNYQTEMPHKDKSVTNPLTKIYSKGDAFRMFYEVGFRDIKVEIHWLRIPMIHKMIPQKIINILGRVMGWHLIIIAKK